ncbi:MULTISPECIES: LysE family translocator [Thalassospira]|jgi:threonine/homoserine/homoserine lactone efflux protein|uniref:LysE family translocator n=1 Tax=Thalassospira indica TaxID=1891279 RepID=A0ABN5NNJ0_9PROT|nr:MULTISPECIES: LysE family translocator [Thalassospira]AXO15921.1 LysE family translocator [Thalassospira indica]EKF07052.1 lysine exporter protein LysE/YggA [Thalassospira profundimaris WP0211]OAZ13479.1 lysine transporter LysE [Thalassospira profundimaris]
MQLDTWLLFAGAAIALAMAPGPNNLLAMFNGARYGVSSAAVGGIGRIVAFALMIVVTAAGLGVVLAASETAFLVIKWGGAVYLVWLGLKSWFAKVNDSDETTGPVELMVNPGPFNLAKTEFLTAIGNPKAILIFTAFFPQFLDPAVAYGPQFTVMGVTFIAMETSVLLAYGLLGGQVKGLIKSARHMRMLNRVSGTLLVGAGVLLALTDRSRTTA